MEKEGRYYNLTPLLEQLTEELKDDIRLSVEYTVDVHTRSLLKETPFPDLFEVSRVINTCAKETATAVINSIQKKGQIFVTTPRWKELGDTPWYDDLTDKLFGEVNT